MKRAAIVVLLVAVPACGGSDDRVVVGAGTTLVDSGFIEQVFEGYDGRVSVLQESSQRLLDLARRGEVDVLLTHQPDALDEFVDEGYATSSQPVFFSEFLLVGPKEPTLEAETMVEAFSEIAQQRLAFVSRADGSGTYRQEQRIWELAGSDPGGEDWYDTTGQGMGLSLQVAAQRGAFVLVESGTWEAIGAELDLDVVPTVRTWPNVYFVTLAEGSGPDAANLYLWLTGSEGADAISAANEAVFGRQLYEYIAP